MQVATIWLNSWNLWFEILTRQLNPPTRSIINRLKTTIWVVWIINRLAKQWEFIFNRETILIKGLITFPEWYQSQQHHHADQQRVNQIITRTIQ